MDYQIVYHEQACHVTFSNRLTFADHETFRRLLSEALQHGVKRLVFNLQNLTFIDSAGLGMFLIAVEEAAKLNAVVELENPRGHVAKILQLTNFNTHLTIRGSDAA